MDFTPFLKIQPDVVAAISRVDEEVKLAKTALDAAQQTYDYLTTQARNLRLVHDMLNGIKPPTV